MATGFIVIPLADESLSTRELRELAAETQSAISPWATHWVDDTGTVGAIARRLNRDGHVFPDCQVCP